MCAVDVIVLGLGAMGSAAAHRLAAAGARTVGFDGRRPPHPEGSSHGGSRVVRQAYFEGSCYVPLAKRAYELWAELGAETGCGLLHRTGGLMIGRRSSKVVDGTLRSAAIHQLPTRLLSPSEVAAELPCFRLGGDDVAVLEEVAGWVDPEAAVAAQLAAAKRHGAVLRCDEPVLDWTAEAGSVAVRTASGVLRGGALVLAGGPWMPGLAAQVGWPLRVTRQVNVWFEWEPPPMERPTPVWVWESGDGLLYGLPAGGDGPSIKLGWHHLGETCDPATVRREVGDDEIGGLRRVARRRLRGVGRPVRAATCLYTNTPDGHFLVGPVPGHPRVLVAAGFSGHGFKFAPAIGELLADLVAGNSPTVPIDDLDPARFAR